MPDDNDLGILFATAMSNGVAVRREMGWSPPPERGGFQAVYSGVLDDISRHAEKRDVSFDQVRQAYDAVTTGERYLTSHDDLMERTDMDYHEARQSAAVLSDVGDIHECYDDDWNLHWVRADEFLREKCEERRISLCRYYKMHDILREFQDKVIAWYVRRNRRQKQPINLRQMKENYVSIIQQKYFEDKPVGDEWSRHIAARYLRTAQDSIIRSMDLTY
jgi:hypothetical protein